MQRQKRTGGANRRLYIYIAIYELIYLINTHNLVWNLLNSVGQLASGKPNSWAAKKNSSAANQITMI